MNKYCGFAVKITDKEGENNFQMQCSHQSRKNLVKIRTVVNGAQ